MSLKISGSLASKLREKIKAWNNKMELIDPMRLTIF
jgi:hypothetical protein